MKKIAVNYSVAIPIEISDKEFDIAMSAEGLDRGDAFNALVAYYAPEFWENLPPDSEIQYVYNPWDDNDFAQPDDDEIYWAQ